MDAPGPGGSRKRKQAVRNDHVIDLTGEDDDSSSPGLPHDGSAGPSRGKARSKSSARPAAKERRVDAEGKTVRYSAAPSQKVRRQRTWHLLMGDQAFPPALGASSSSAAAAPALVVPVCHL